MLNETEEGYSEENYRENNGSPMKYFVKTAFCAVYVARSAKNA